MTTHARIIIIGGGIVGTSTLYHLAKAGEKDALLLERRQLTAGATWHAAGNVHTQSAYANLSALQAYSLRLYDGLAEEVGQEVGSHIVGGFFLAQTKERMEEFKHLAGKFRSIGLEYDLVTPDEIKAKYPLLNVSDLEGGAWDPEEGYVDPYSVTMGLAAGARKYGGKIKQNCQVDSITRLPSGQWRLTANDEVFECETIVNCAGFWAREVAEMVGTTVPITNMEHQYLVTDTMPEVAALGYELPMIRDCDSQYYLRQEGQGLLLGPWEQNCRTAWSKGRAPWSFGQELFEDDWDRLGDGLASIFHRVPALDSAGIKRGVNGAISFAPDGRPMIGPMPGVPNFFVACGFLGGIAQGGGIGLAMSQWILEGETELDLHFIDVARFGDWTTREFARERTHEILPIRYELIYPGIERKTGRPLKTTPIYNDLLSHGAVMGQAYGWERPLWYAPNGEVDEPSFQRPNWWDHVGREATAMAAGCGLSDMSSYGKFRISGPDAQAFLDHIGSAKVPSKPGKVALLLMLNERGGIVGDITIENSDDGSFYCVGATMGVALYQRWMEDHAGDFAVSIENITDQFAAIGIAGPKSRALLNTLSADDFDDFPFMSSKQIDIGRVRCTAIRISFSGELGWELHCPMLNQKALFDALMTEGKNHDLILMGGRAMGMLRIEKGYRSWGAEMTTEVTPHAAGLQRFCSKTKDYIGRSVVDRQRDIAPAKVFVTVEVDANAPPCWGTEPVLKDGQLIGYVTSGGMGWRCGKMLAVCWIDAKHRTIGGALDLQVLGQIYLAKVLADPVFDPNNQHLLG
ncbi:FAD-dependent oxidoreductase [Octadecabacter sp. G9-8]|uniref:FAD-dependent oxidoreductase n=1 Tax=Octadecabacter dasysiphoniae TaxID=2909341 RepID=A0ABS9CXY9_9RHOB|nr:FAD-dependent oxidoreductase [Octadecabacter dasysiphoniae]MCF2872008.1 FAD-dependent oxidoreductase [Octadecabacter dasysiphoniae]